ncbi:hypothetical protein TCAL_17335 [Tigriopus californicus]|uniref:Uncharacterized protein n=1 Tax=Tigriopus californicus TaxID=6832 RepID=A0A553NYF5_TIGCA|nr:secreted protein C-like [Tigriopus californicus]TRY70460.1 hypothetical protein TCAL_17335 [Tigriopus californicus]
MSSSTNKTNHGQQCQPFHSHSHSHHAPSSNEKLKRSSGGGSANGNGNGSGVGSGGGGTRDQPTIKVEHFPSSPSHNHDRSVSNSRRNSPSGSSSSSRRGSDTKEGRNQSRKNVGKSSPVSDEGGSRGRGRNQHKLGESSLGLDLQMNLQVRRKSSPCIGGLQSASLLLSNRLSGSSSPSRYKSPKDLRPQISPTIPTPHGTSSSSSAHHQHYHQRRRLSSPPNFEPRYGSGLGSCDCGLGECASGGASSGSNHSSGHGSLSQLAISGLNCSSTDMREHTLRSGHQQIQTLYAANNVTYPESISINMCNAPDDSTVQCDCGHINCPLCNLMMNLELTDPNVLK